MCWEVQYLVGQICIYFKVLVYCLGIRVVSYQEGSIVFVQEEKDLGYDVDYVGEDVVDGVYGEVVGDNEVIW